MTDTGQVDGQRIVPEHEVKRMLADHGVSVPRGAVGSTGVELLEGLGESDSPLVLKAYGPGLLHKSDVGAVRLGLDASSLGPALDSMKERLEGQGLAPDGFLAEEQHPGGIELIVGMVRDPSFGHVVLLGLGGIATELLDLAAVRVAPLTREDARDLVNTFPGAPLLTGARGREPVDVDALVDLLMNIAGPDSMFSQVGAELAEFECNPVVATADGVQALDARLILSAAPAARAHKPEPDFSKLFSPRTVAVAGASASKSTFGNRFLAAYKGIGRADGVYALHPQASEIDGVPAYPRLSGMPAVPDYLVAAVPAAVTPQLVAEASDAGVPFVHVITGGFAEMGAAGSTLQESLYDSIRGGTRLLGPNCLGVYSPAGRQAFTLNAPKDVGRVSVVSQSGGLSGDMITAGAARGIRYAHLVSIGNSIDVQPAELVNWLVSDQGTDVIGIYLEGTRSGAELRDALLRAKGRKPVVLLRGGSSEQGAAAVASHTGSLASGEKIWSSVCESTGTTQVRTLEQFLSCVQYLQQYREAPTSRSRGVLVVGLGGGASVLATDAIDRSGNLVTPIADDIRRQLRDAGLGAGTSVANPLEVPVGPTSPVDVVSDALKRVLRPDRGGQGEQGGQEFADTLVHVNMAAYYNYGTAGIAPLIDALRSVLAAELPTRVAVVVRNSTVAVADDLERIREFARETGLPVFFDFDEAAIAISAAQRFDAAVN